MPRILIVDDEEVNLKILRWTLEEEGFDIEEATSGKQVLDLLDQDPNFDVILLDRMMDDMNGMEVLDKIKQHDTLKNIPIVMQSAAATKEQQQQGLDAGVAFYLAKPFEKEDILHAIEQAFKQSSAV